MHPRASPTSRKKEKKQEKMGGRESGHTPPFPRRDRHQTSFFNRVAFGVLVFGKHTLRVAYFPIQIALYYRLSDVQQFLRPVTCECRELNFCVTNFEAGVKVNAVIRTHVTHTHTHCPHKNLHESSLQYSVTYFLDIFALFISDYGKA